MHLKNVAVKNFRLLHDVNLLLEKKTTVIVGRNNSGKTSLTEVMRRLLTDGPSTFRLEDFSFAAHEGFWKAFLAASGSASDDDVRKLLPTIEIRLTFAYDTAEILGALNQFIIDLNVDCTDALVVARYALREGKVHDLFADLSDTGDAARPLVFQELRERVPEFFGVSLVAIDPNDPTNEKSVDLSALRALCGSGFISAQRGLDDASQKERVVIGKVLENLFTTAKANADDAENHSTAEELEEAVKDIQDKIGQDFNLKLDALLPALTMFGYPGLTDPQLRTETTLDVERLLANHTKVRYTGANGIHLPEAYNGLGMRNIILILLQLREFFKIYCATEPRPGVQIVFIEEPEVHLHPQMQEVFIRKLNEIAALFSQQHGALWPVQFVVSTHSSHVANEAHFETIRYFLSVVDPATNIIRTVVKDLQKGLASKADPDRTFLHKYLTLTRCDLFFADKAVLIEGTTERLLLPRIISKMDEALPLDEKLGSQYLTVMEIGGAYAHIFFDLLEFLELRTLIITDIDSVKINVKQRYVACPVVEGERTSNACIKNWFSANEIDPAGLHAIPDDQKIVGRRRLAFQQPETANGPCGRSFEDAFMHANPNLHPLSGTTRAEMENEAWTNAKELKKSNFALEIALMTDEWTIPRYIREGLLWLATCDIPAAAIPAPSSVVLS